MNRIVSKYNADMSIGVIDGCYGSSSGKQSDGYTLYLPLELAQEHFSHGLAQYSVNPLHEIEAMGGEFHVVG